MRVRGERVHHAHALIGKSVARINDAERSLTSGYIEQRDADVFRTRQAGGDLVSDAELRERRARVAASGDRIWIAGCQPAFSESRRERKVRRNVELDLALRWSDQHEAITQDVLAARRLDEVAALQVVHPIRVCREKDIRRGAGFDLPREHRTRIKRRLYRYRHSLFVGRTDLLHGIGKGGRGEYQDLRLLRARSSRRS